ncbi:MAG TPA: DUF4838 domain-containing protein [Terrimicrobiaceae bacterium]|nr:DUF4838 domain-containing protein [Terrimicrobiaceae bacterium]
MKTRAILLGLVIVGLLPSGAIEAADLMVSHTFEGETPGVHVPQGWAGGSSLDPSRAEIVTVAGPVSGTLSLKNGGGGTSTTGIISQRILVDPQRPLTISGWVKASGTVSGAAGAYFSIFWYDAAGNPVPRAPGQTSNTRHIGIHSGTSWTKYSYTFVPESILETGYPVPAAAERCEVRLFRFSNYPLDSWYDDISVDQGSGNLLRSFEIGANTPIQIQSTGSFGTAASVTWSGTTSNIVVTDFTASLKKALGKTNLASGGGSPVTVVLESRAADWHALPPAELEDLSNIDKYEITADAAARTVTIKGATAVAVSYGTMAFLERYLNAFWAMPGALGECFSNLSSFQIPHGGLTDAPFAISRVATGIQAVEPGKVNRGQGEGGITDFNQNHFNAYDFFKNWKMHSLASPSHNMINIFPAELQNDSAWWPIFPVETISPLTYYFPPLTPADPREKQMWHPNYTETLTKTRATNVAMDAFSGTRNRYATSGPLNPPKQFCFSLGINDGAKIHPSKDAVTVAQGVAKTYYDMVAQVADSVASATDGSGNPLYNGRLVGVLAYSDVSQPPAGLTDLPDNVLILSASLVPSAWIGKASHLGAYEYFFGQGFWVPNFPLAAMKSNSGFYETNNFRYFRGEWHPLWAFDGPKDFLRAKQLWNPDYDCDAGLKEYCRRAFGAGVVKMDLMYRLWAAKQDAEVQSGSVTRMATDWRHVFKQFRRWCSPADLDQTDQYILDAKTLVTAERDAAGSGTRAQANAQSALNRLSMVEAFFKDSRTLYAMYDVCNVSGNENATGDAAQRAALAGTLNDERQSGLAAIHANQSAWLAGTSAAITLTGTTYRPNWEPNSTVMPLPQLMPTVRLTEAFRVNPQTSGQSLPAAWNAPNFPELQPYLRPYALTSRVLKAYATTLFPNYSGWFPASKSNPLVSSFNVPKTEWYFSTDNTKIGETVPEGDYDEGTLKYQGWFTVSLAVTPGVPLVVEADLSGIDGDFVLDAWNLDTDLIFYEKFGGTETTTNKRALVIPKSSGSGTFNMTFRVYWYPTSSSSRLNGGKLTVKNAAFQP